MKTTLRTIFSFTILVAVVGATIVPVNADDVIRRITGGSTGRFIATPHSLTTSGYSDFSINATLAPDGSASGEFTCAIPDFVVLAVQISTWHRRADGSIELTGTEYGYDAVGGVGYADCPATIVMRRGPAGLGGFDFSDCVFPEGMYDTEVVLYGSIDFRHN